MTLYRYKLREHEHSGIWLWLRLKVTGFMNNIVLGNIFPVHEVVVLNGEMGEWE